MVCNVEVDGGIEATDTLRQGGIKDPTAGTGTGMGTGAGTDTSSHTTISVSSGWTNLSSVYLKTALNVNRTIISFWTLDIIVL